MSQDRGLYKLLLVDDDFTSSTSLRSYLESQGNFKVDWERDGDSGLIQATSDPYDCIILDINLPGLNGFEVLRILRNRGIGAQVLIISVRGREEDIIRGLELGADDYLIKPFSMPEIQARLQARVRRSSKPEGIFEYGNIKIDLNSLSLTTQTGKSSLSAREGRLLKIFMENTDRVLSREQILDMVWGVDYMGTSRTVDNFVVNLRKKVEVEGSTLKIATVRGLGYKLEVSS
jgi:DNA-binding response OmpR family regulator